MGSCSFFFKKKIFHPSQGDDATKKSMHVKENEKISASRKGNNKTAFGKTAIDVVFLKIVVAKEEGTGREFHSQGLRKKKLLE